MFERKYKNISMSREKLEFFQFFSGIKNLSFHVNFLNMIENYILLIIRREQKSFCILFQIAKMSFILFLE